MMNRELRTIIEDFKVLAQQSRWMSIADCIDSLRSKRHSQEILILSAERVETTSFKRWIETTLNRELPCSGIETIKEPLPILAATKVVVLLECGRLLDASTVDAIKSAVLERPLKSYAIVYGNAERIANEEDLSLIERGARRLLVASPMGYLAQKELSEYQIFLWGDGEISSFLKNRIQQDQKALEAWGKKPLACQDDLDRYQLLSLIALAEQQIQEVSSGEVRGVDVSVKRLTNTESELKECRQRLVRQIESDLDLLRRELTTSLRTLEQDVLYGIGAYLQKQGAQITSESPVIKFMSEGIERWQEQSEKLLASRISQTLSDARDLLENVNWSVVNEVSVYYGETAAYPTSLLQWLKTAFQFPANNISITKMEGNHTKVADSTQIIISAAGGAAGGALVGYFTAAFFGPLAFLVPATAATTGALLAGSAVYKSQRAKLLSEDKDQSRIVIERTISQAESEVNLYMRDLTKDICKKVSEKLQMLEQMVGTRVREIGQPTKQEDLPKINGEVLWELRQKVIKLVSSNDRKPS
nr:hypothetical protein [uncultured Desulfobacter sp.]